MQKNNNQNDDRFFGGFAVPFLLGGIGGYALGNSQPNNYYPYPYPVPYPYPYPNTYSYNNYYYPYY